MDDKKKESVIVGKSSFKLANVEILNIIFGVFYFLIITRTFSNIDIATIGIMSIIMALSSLFSDFGLNSTTTKLIPEYISNKETQKTTSLIQLTYLIIISITLILVYFTFHFSHFLSLLFFKKNGFENIIKIIAFSIFTNRLLETSLYNLTSLQKFTTISFIQVFNYIVIRIYALFLYFSNGINGYLLGLISGQFILSVWAIFEIKGFIFKKSPVASISQTLKYSLPFYANRYIRYGSTQADSLIISLFFKPELFAVYYVAKRFINYIESYVTALLRPLSPKMIEMKKHGKETIQKIFYKSTRYLSFTIIPVILFIISLSYFLLHIYGKGRYISGIPILIILSIAAMFNSFYSLFVGPLFVMAEPVEITKVGLINAILIVFFMLIFVRFGILGVAGSILLSNIISIGVIHIWNKKFITLKVDWTGIKRIFYISMPPFILIIVLQILYYSTFLSVLYAISGICLFTFLFLRFISKEDKLFIKEIIFKK